VNNEVTYLEENTCTNEYHFGRRENLSDRDQSEISDRSINTHQTNPSPKRLRKCMQNADRRLKPSLQSLVAAPGFVELVDLVLKYSKNVRRRVACLELGSERMSGEITSSLFSVFLESFFEDDIEIRRGC
jgi:hypothetical protein